MHLSVKLAAAESACTVNNNNNNSNNNNNKNNNDDDDKNDNSNINNNGDNDGNNDDNCIEWRNSRLSFSPHCAANCLRHIRSNSQGAIVCKLRATHRALITCTLSCATFNERTAQLLRLTELKLHLFELYFIGLNGSMKEERKAEYPEKTPYDELQKMPHTKSRDSNPHSSIGGKLGKRTC